MSPSSQLRTSVTELSKSSAGFSYALTYARAELFRMEACDEPAAAVADARMVLAELLQKQGLIAECHAELAAIDTGQLSASARHGVLLIRAKLAMQSGDLAASRDALQSLKDRLGRDSAVAMNQVYLWRQAFTLGVLGESSSARRLHDEHESLTDKGGFQEANRILYAELLPSVAGGDKWVLRGSRSFESVRTAGTLYLESDVDYLGRFNNRGKSFCQALLVEAFLWWLMGNLFYGYRLGFVAVLLLRHWQLNLRSEGIGEVIGILQELAPALTAAVRAVANGQDAALRRTGASSRSDGPAVHAAYVGAVELVRGVVAGAPLVDLYAVLDDRRL
jgi:hypothetical protein